MQSGLVNSYRNNFAFFQPSIGATFCNFSINPLSQCSAYFPLVDYNSPITRLSDRNSRSDDLTIKFSYVLTTDVDRQRHEIHSIKINTREQLRRVAKLQRMTMSTATQEPSYVFVYGTLRYSYTQLPCEIRDMTPPNVLEQEGTWKGEGFLYGYNLLDLGMYPGIVPCEESEHVVKGDLFHIGNRQDVLRELDHYEGIDDGSLPPFEYRREKVTVRMRDADGNDTTLQTWVYVYNLTVLDHHIVISDGDYVKYCRRKRDLQSSLNL